MENFVFHNDTEIIFGKDSEKLAGQKIGRLGHKALLLYGGGSIKKTGLYQKVTASLQSAGVEFVEMSGVQPNPRLGLVREGIAFSREQGVDCILAVGGGSVIDSVKAIAAGARYEGDVWDLFAGHAVVRDNALPVGVILTIPAAGSESSIRAVITNEDGMLKRGLGSPYIRPRFAVLNPELTFTLPFYQTACGVCDMLAHVMERYFTPTKDVDVTDRMCEAVMRSIITIGPKLKEYPDDYAARAEIMWAGTVAHNDSLGVGRAQDWAAHLIEHEISAIYDIAHGAGLSIIFPAWMRYLCPKYLPRFVQFAERVFDVDMARDDSEAIALEGIRHLEEFYKRMELPVRLREAGIDDERLEEMAQKAAPAGRDAGRLLDCEDILSIYRLAL